MEKKRLRQTEGLVLRSGDDIVTIITDGMTVALYSSAGRTFHRSLHRAIACAEAMGYSIDTETFITGTTAVVQN